MEEKDLEEMSWPILENILKAHAQKSYKLLAKNFCEDCIDQLPDEDEFNEVTEEMLEPLGNMISAAYLGNVNKGDVNLVLWKVAFGKSEEELLWHLYLGDDMKVQALWFG